MITPNGKIYLDERTSEMKFSRRILIALSVIMLILSVALGIVRSTTRSRSAIFGKEIALGEDVTLDDPYIVDAYGSAITLKKGTSGEASDVIDSSGDTLGYEYINAHFMYEGTILQVAIAINPEVNSATEYRTNVVTIPVISIYSIESYNDVLDEYEQSRDVYYSSVNSSRISGVVTSLIISLIVLLVFYFIYILSSSENVSAFLFVIISSVDIVLLLLVAIACVTSFAN